MNTAATFGAGRCGPSAKCSSILPSITFRIVAMCKTLCDLRRDYQRAKNDFGQWCSEPCELHRVYLALRDVTDSDGAGNATGGTPLFSLRPNQITVRSDARRDADGVMSRTGDRSYHTTMKDVPFADVFRPVHRLAAGRRFAAVSKRRLGGREDGAENRIGLQPPLANDGGGRRSSQGIPGQILCRSRA